MIDKIIQPTQPKKSAFVLIRNFCVSIVLSVLIKLVRMTGLEPVIYLGVNEAPLPLSHIRNLKLVGMLGFEPRLFLYPKQVPYQIRRHPDNNNYIIKYLNVKLNQRVAPILLRVLRSWNHAMSRLLGEACQICAVTVLGSRHL